jgi:hypothetical protein
MDKFTGKQELYKLLQCYALCKFLSLLKAGTFRTFRIDIQWDLCSPEPFMEQGNSLL